VTTLSVSVADGDDGDSLTVAIRGELDIATAADFTARLEELIRDDLRRLVIDVSGLTFVDAVGLRALTALRIRAGQRRITVVLAGAQPQMSRLMSIIRARAVTRNATGPGWASSARRPG
jgi:anti-sigma B factor antagonist